MEKVDINQDCSMLNFEVPETEYSSDFLSKRGLADNQADSATSHSRNATAVCTCPQSQSRQHNRFTNGLHCQHHKSPSRRDKLLKARKLCARHSVDKYTMKSSVRLCLHGFIMWLFVANPIICDILRGAASWTDHPFVGPNVLAAACRPRDQPGFPRTKPISSPLLKQGEFLPRYSEQSPIASGPVKGPVHFNSTQLVTVITTMIVFKDDEANMEDRRMTKRCEDKLLSLALLVTNELNSRLRVTEAWAPEGSHGPNSLHYEGRAVDINLASGDTSSYPFLARLAYDAGFDWVHYASKNHIHCSVRSDQDEDNNSITGRCFPGDAEVVTPSGETVPMSKLREGDQVLSIDRWGNVVPDTVLTFMDLQTDRSFRRDYVSIVTETGKELRLTPSHLVYVSSQMEKINDESPLSAWNAFKFTSWRTSLNVSSKILTPTATFAGRVKAGQYLFELPNDDWGVPIIGAPMRPQKIVRVELTTSNTGAYAPLTTQGTIIVNNVAASCYAAIDSDLISHAVMWPVRLYHSIRLTFADLVTSQSAIQTRTQGVSLYSRLLHEVASYLLPESIFVGA
uniref:Hedgehog protein n=1 Tax=Phallusia mammillata TaxID=59560 RepID=A0A6F9DRI3_9ASCI|nr:Hh1 hedgehog homolog 1 [Phallusia mammillata]